jgi:DNA-binding NtrC family response regulator
MSDEQMFSTTEDASLEERAAQFSRRPFLFVVLHCDRPHLGGARVGLSGLDVVTIGRGAAREASRVEAEGARRLDLRLPSTTVSKSHARLVRSGDAWFLEDEGSRNGCYINGKRVTYAALHDGDFLETGSVFLRYRAALPASPAAADLDSEHHTPEAQGFMTLLPSLADALGVLARIARTEVAILLLGETGTGKELLAAGAHALSSRPGPLVAVNCGGLAPTLLESQMFGHLKGAFTGAHRDNLGFIRSADGGTLLLDEIGDLPLPAQAALLRALQEREVVPVGGTRPLTVDLRVVSATHRPLDALCLRGEFRSDLLARLSGHRFTLPPLRERIEDLGVLIRDILRRLDAPAAGQTRLAVPAARRLLSYAWPLNVRELLQALSVAATLAGGAPIESAHLPESLLKVAIPPAPVEMKDDPSGGENVEMRLVALLERHRGNVSEVARLMRTSRAQIHRWMQRFGLNPDEYRT